MRTAGLGMHPFLFLPFRSEVFRQVWCPHRGKDFLTCLFEILPGRILKELSHLHTVQSSFALLCEEW